MVEPKKFSALSPQTAPISTDEVVLVANERLALADLPKSWGAGALGAAETLLGVNAAGDAVEFKSAVAVTSITDTVKIVDDGDANKAMQFQCSGITAGQIRVLTVPDFNLTIAPLDSPIFTTTVTLPIAIFNQQSAPAAAANVAKLWAQDYAAGDTRLYLQSESGNPILFGNNELQLYNTADITVNYERGFMRWNSNVLEIGIEKGGSGTTRALALYGAGGLDGGSQQQILKQVYVAGIGWTSFGIGPSALANCTGYYNVAIGYSALLGAVTPNGDFNTAIGANTLRNMSIGDLNVGVGASAGAGLTDGTGNVFVGAYTATSGYGMVGNAEIDDSCIYIGLYTGRSVIATTKLTGALAIGSSALVGADNAIAIGYFSRCDLANSMVLGGWGSYTADVYLPGKISGLCVQNIATPAQPTVTPVGTTGATTWGYKITAINSVGETLGSTEGTTATGNATLTVDNYNKIDWVYITGAKQYKVYRTTAGGTPATTGLIGTVSALTLNDTALVASDAEPTVNTSGYLQFGTYAAEVAAVAGYITIKDAGGTLRKLAIIA